MIIYKTTNLLNGKIYVGKDLKNNPGYIGSGLLLKRAIKKYGIENFVKETIEYCDTADILNEREIYWISELKSTDKSIGYNIARGGAGGDTISNNPNNSLIREKQRQKLTGRSFTEEHKQNISKAKKGKPTKPNVYSEESRLKMSAAKKGKTLSEEHKKKLSLARQGRKPALGSKWSEESRQKRIEKYKNEGHPSGFSLEITNITDGEVTVFKSANQAARFFKCNIHRILNDKLEGYKIIKK